MRARVAHLPGHPTDLLRLPVIRRAPPWGWGPDGIALRRGSHAKVSFRQPRRTFMEMSLRLCRLFASVSQRGFSFRAGWDSTADGCPPSR